jgi:hypothetical protein
MSYRVIQWATGQVGVLSLRQLIDRPDVELVGVKVYSAAKDGLDAGLIAGGKPVGVAATRDVDALLRTEADCVVYMAAEPAVTDPTRPGTHGYELVTEICALLESGKNIVATSLLPLVWPSPAWQPAVDRIEAAGRHGGTSFHVTGVHPGFALDRTAAFVSGLAASIDHVRIEAGCSNWARYDDMPTLRARGFGLTPEEFRAGGLEDVSSEHNDWVNEMGTSIRAVAGGLGAHVDEYRGTFRYSLAAEDFDISAGTIRAGTIAAVRVNIEALEQGAVRVVTDQTVGVSDAAVAELAPGERTGAKRIVVAGEPPLSITVDWGGPGRVRVTDSLLTTAAIAVNSIPSVCAARPGFVTFVDLPMVHGRFGPPGS